MEETASMKAGRQAGRQARREGGKKTSTNTHQLQQFATKLMNHPRHHHFLPDQAPPPLRAVHHQDITTSCQTKPHLLLGLFITKTSPLPARRSPTSS
ncbi:hypothetical protein Pmani_018551 [Petrolisthes manimaculis]|uniref:Uncharacterized protein n=1 Tax=Petrolisthes manimaculis TaxID=1843537 RepID=A0AAE1U895_9EUCA|nr:hypothetical protein Pmani_018551 [Petrolisthes manimaculis]